MLAAELIIHKMLPHLISNVEYVILRLLRRFLFPRDLHRWGRYLPFYRVNLGETQPDQICRPYLDWLTPVGRNVTAQRVIEVGSGATNGVGYALICAGASQVWCVEPYVAFDQYEDAALLNELARLHRRDAAVIAASVSRCASFDSVGAGVADVILSHSVLEHVGDLAALFSDMHKALAPAGAMLHIVDYRDHFFKYPLHFLQFSKWTWRKFLDPGDLPRWRLKDHQVALESAGFVVRVLHKEEDQAEFERVRPHISCDFDRLDPRLAVVRAVLFCDRAVPTSAVND